MELNWKKKEGTEELVTREGAGVPYLSFAALEKTGLVIQGFSTKLGGVSVGDYATMNLSFKRGDNAQHVMENYRRMGKALGVDEARMVLSAQTHTTNIRKVTEEDAGKGIKKVQDYRETDGLITNVPGITLVTFYADCVPLYFLDPIHQAIGLSHSGWRGTVHHMGPVTIDCMAQSYGSKAADLIACIGPSICRDCYEVGEEVAEEFRCAFPKKEWDQLLTNRKKGKYQLDLWYANRLLLIEAGVNPKNIHITNLCTHCNFELLFSHRKAGDRRGNLAAFLSLRERSVPL